MYYKQPLTIIITLWTIKTKKTQIAHLLRRSKININQVHLRPRLAHINIESSIVHKCNSSDVFSFSFISDSVPYGSSCTCIIRSLHPETDRESYEIWKISNVDMPTVIFNEVQLVVTILYKVCRRKTSTLKKLCHEIYPNSVKTATKLDET